MPAYNEEQIISKVIKRFKKIPEVNEVIVVDNNSIDRTVKLAKKAGARVVKESKQGYGFACRRALKEAKDDIIVLTESDGSFEPSDIYKFIAYLNDVDFVLGTRTTLELVEPGAKMDWFLLYGNVFLAKLIQLRFLRRVRLTDVGCTYRAIKRRVLMKIMNNLKVGGPHFSPEMIIEALKAGLKIVEIPINYKIRVGESKITSNKFKSFKVGLRMLKLIFFR
jgi:glycosyltransferase involved in cell wall biosynthesis